MGMLAALALFTPVALPAATVVRQMVASEANQGVAVDARSIYAITNNEIGRYDKKTGVRIAHWKGERALYRHINSCAVVGRELVCAASNYPALPMMSSIEVFDKVTLKPIRTRALPVGPGSLTVLDWHRGSWWAVYANYDGRGGLPGRDHSTGVLVRMDAGFSHQAAWLFPASVLDRFKPHHASGAVWGSDGLLYASGHDRPEIYALRLPVAGSTLEHVATIPVSTAGQAIDWDDADKRVLWTIDRPTRGVVASRMPVLGK